MKKRGSSLASVLIASSLLLGLGTAVSATVVNTTKLNERYSDNIDLELAAKSALSYGIDYLTINYRTINDEGFKREGILVDDQTNITKSIEISKSGDEFTIIGRAKLNGNSEISAEESTVIKISNENTNPNPDPIPDPTPDPNPNPDPNPDPTPDPTPDPDPDEPNDSESADATLVFDKLFNIGRNINSFGNNNQSAIDYFQYGESVDLGGNNNKYDSNGNKVLPQKNEELANMNLSINTNEILQYISKYSNENIKTHNNESITANNTTIKYDQLNGNNTNISLNSSKVLFSNGGNSQNSNYIEVIGDSDNNSELIFGGNTTFNSGMNIKNINNSKIIVNGDLNVWNGAFKIENSSNSVFVINGNLKNSGSGIDINLKNSVLIVAGDIEPQNNFRVTLENSAIICLGNLKLNTQINIYNNGDSFIYCGKDFSCSSEIKIYTQNGGYTPNSSVVNNAIGNFISSN